LNPTADATTSPRPKLKRRTICKHHRDRVDPSACASVLEGGGAGRIGGNRAADECAIKGRHLAGNNGPFAASACWRAASGDARANPYAAILERIDGRQRARAENEVTARRGAAGQRRTARQSAARVGRPQQARPRPLPSRGNATPAAKPPGNVRGVAEKGLKISGTGLDRRRARFQRADYTGALISA
jgi:hypothetical protein